MGLWLSLFSTPSSAEVFVDVPELLALQKQGAAVVDARGGESWHQGRVPDAGSLSWWALRAGQLRTGLLTDDLEHLLEYIQKAGVSQDKPVVVVGQADQGWGEEGRIFWTLEVLGHKDVHILDGGLRAWQDAGQPLEYLSRPARGDFVPQAPGAQRADLARVRQAAETGDALIWDTRSEAEFHGATPAGERRGGHIPGAKNLFWKELLDEEGRLLPAKELERKLTQTGIVRGQPIISLCTGGVRAGFGYAVLRELGYSELMVYDGSMWEWSADADLPLEL